MSGIRDLLGGSGGEVIPPPPPMVLGEKLYTVSGKYAGTAVVSGHPLAGGWVSVAFSNQIKLQMNGSIIETDPTAPMQGYALHTNSAQNAAILWGTVQDDGTCTFDGMSPDFADPSCLLPASASIPYGGRLLFISDGIWNYGVMDGSGNFVDYVYPLVWDGGNNLTAVLLFNNVNTYSNVEYNTFVRCNLDVAAIEDWLGQHTCP